MDTGYEIKRLEKRIERLDKKIGQCLAELEQIKKMQAQGVSRMPQAGTRQPGKRDLPREDRQPPM